MASISDDQAQLLKKWELFQQFLAMQESSHLKAEANIAREEIAQDSDEDFNEDSEYEFDEESAKEDSSDLYGTQTPSNSTRKGQPNVWISLESC